MKRYSFADVFEQVDYKAGVQQREALVLKSRLRNIHQEILGRRDARSYLEALGAPGEFLDISDEIDRWVQEESNPLIAARMHAFQGELFSSQGFAEAVNRASAKNVIIRKFYGTEDLRIAQANLAGDKALRKVAEAVEASIGHADAIDLSRIVSDRVEILSPARVDLGEAGPTRRRSASNARG